MVYYDTGPSTRERIERGDKRPRCTNCEHFRHARGMACRAFPEGIPQQIMSGEVSHLEPVPGDGGIQYTPKED